MKKMTREELDKELRKEARMTLGLAVLIALIHIIPAFLLNGNGKEIFHMPQWFVISVGLSAIVAIVGVLVITKNFADFDYDEEAEK